jgi:hypothetical protein
MLSLRQCEYNYAPPGQVWSPAFAVASNIAQHFRVLCRGTVLGCKVDMALPFDASPDAPRDVRALPILAKTLYRDLRASGYSAKDVLALAGELIGLISSDLRGRPKD